MKGRHEIRGGEMTRKHWIAIGFVAVLAALFLVNLKAKSGGQLAVQVEEVTRRDIEMIISASGMASRKWATVSTE